jgi:hypothetical protein
MWKQPSTNKTAREYTNEVRPAGFIRVFVKNSWTAVICLSARLMRRGGSDRRGYTLGMMALRMMGWTDVRNLGGGIGAWTAAELPLVTP